MLLARLQPAAPIESCTRCCSDCDADDDMVQRGETRNKVTRQPSAATRRAVAVTYHPLKDDVRKGQGQMVS